MTIEEMLRSGITEEQIMAELNAAKKKIADERLHKEELKDLKESAIDALLDYVDALYPIGEKDLNTLRQNLSKEIDKMEKTISYLGGIIDSLEKPKKKSTDEILREWVQTLR